jgi:hypothetical protein
VILVIGNRHASASGAIHALLWAAVAESVFAVAALIPLRLRERRGGPAINTDGMIVLSALTTMFARGSRKPRSPANSHPASPHRSTQQRDSGSAALNIRVWRHDDHLHIGVGTTYAFDTRTAAATTLAPANARRLGHAILNLADEAEQPADVSQTVADRKPSRANLPAKSLPPPGYSE